MQEFNHQHASALTCMPLLFASCVHSQKVIGCRYFYDGVGGSQQIKQRWPGESISCRQAWNALFAAAVLCQSLPLDFSVESMCYAAARSSASCKVGS
jgi:hypothetical protein